jgi:hypothetical protein
MSRGMTARPPSARGARGPGSCSSTTTRVPPGAVSKTELTEELITAAMAKAEARVCVGSDRCYTFPDRLEDARQTCTPKGRCKVGWIVVRKGGTQAGTCGLR